VSSETVNYVLIGVIFNGLYAAVLFRRLQPGLTNSAKLRNHPKLLEIQK
jgi:hypothetical protein